MSFELPAMFDAPTGWGPPKTDAGLPFDIPYQPFFKGDRIGQLLTSSKGRGGGGRGKVGYYDIPVDDEEKTWTTADYHKPQARGRPFRARGRWGNQGRGGGMHRNRPGGGRGQMGTKPKLRKDHRDGGFGYRGRRDVHRSASIDIKADWKQVATMPLSDLSKLNVTAPVPAPRQEDTKTLAEEGEAMFYNTFFDKVKASEPVDIVNMGRSLEDASVVESKKIREICAKLMKDAGSEVQVYATDSVLATLMAAPQSTVAWDISIERFNNAYFLGWRKGTAVDMWTVNETAQDQPPMEEPTQASATDRDRLNIQPKLMKEMTGLTLNFSQQVLNRKVPVPVKQQVSKAPVPESCEANNTKPASVIYRYRSWDLKQEKEADPKIKVVARTHADGFLERAKKYYRTFALLDLSAAAFRPRLMRNEDGALTAQETINNGTRLAKQACVAHLAGCDTIKLGFVSRKKADRGEGHQLLKMTKYEPRELIGLMKLSFKGMWNILQKILLDVIRCKNDEMQQKFVLMKDPNTPVLKLFDIGQGGDEEDEDEDDEEEEEEEEEESESEESK